MKRFFFALTLFALPLAMTAQQNDWQFYFEQLLDEMQDDTGDEELEELSEALSAAAADPINLNAVTREELEELLFLSNTQVEAIVEYVHRYGPLMTKGELMMIPVLDETRRNLLSCLTFLGEGVPKEIDFLDSLKMQEAREAYRKTFSKVKNRGEAAAYIKIPFYERRGDKKGYYGYQYKDWLRVNYKITNRLKIGAIASQDAGEPFFANKNGWGWDYYTGFIQLQKTGILKNLVVGHYRLKTGLGLILNNNLSFGKTFGLAAAQTSATVIHPHNSRSEANYLQGAALTLAITKNADVTLFGSYRKIDATLTSDSAAIQTIVTTGYHRTLSELNRKHNASQTAAGIYLRYNIGRFNFGLTGVFNHYSLPLRPYRATSTYSTLYRYFAAAGNDFWNISVNYGYKLGSRLRIEGETATGDCGMVATINTASWLVSSKLTLSAIYRYYPAQFYATMGKSFSEGGANQDENGIYIGATWTPSDRLSVNAYTDYAYFNWPKYLALGPSRSFDEYVQASYQLTPTSTLTLRYRVKFRQRNSDVARELIYKDEHRLRMIYNVDINSLSLRSQADMSYCSYKEKSAGFMFYETAKYSMKPCIFALGAGYFNTKDYDSRIYAYEQSLPYNFSSLSFYGNGLRLHCMIEARMFGRLSLIGKLGFTHYFDRDEIGTSYQTIYSSSQTDLELMVRCRL
ncbi:MAG: helix-hairpin-helix domain-containing protein [Prevotella sp.]|nr:helix-hairpin-helix domain-containing protein [Prevotella sp.]